MLLSQKSIVQASTTSDSEFCVEEQVVVREVEEQVT
jgi:hypothetical protein